MRRSFHASGRSLLSSPRLLFREFTQTFLDVILPSSCSACGGEVQQWSALGICASCWETIQPWSGSVCSRCGLPLAATSVEHSPDYLCGVCRTQPFHFDWARVYGLYRGVLRHAILQLKFGHRERLARRLGSLLASVWREHEVPSLADAPLVVPVPLHASREWIRGFNQSALLAEALVQSVPAGPRGRGPQLAPRLLTRVRATTPQTGLSLSARRENVRGVFRARRPERIRDRVVVLVDDVMTTGSTLSACAHALKVAGAARVLALAMARATPQFPDLPGSNASAEVDGQVVERT